MDVYWPLPLLWWSGLPVMPIVSEVMILMLMFLDYSILLYAYSSYVNETHHCCATLSHRFIEAHLC